jgi:hypothetical protein
MNKAGNENTEIVMVDGAGVPFEQARRALLMGIQAVAEERDERFNTVEEARLLRFQINKLTENLLEAQQSENVISLPVGTGAAQAVKIALQHYMMQAQESKEGYVPVSASIHWVERGQDQARCRSCFIITDKGEVAILRSRTLIVEAQHDQPGRLERKEWVSAKTLEALVPFIEKGFDFEIFLDEVLHTLT